MWATAGPLGILTFKILLLLDEWQSIYRTLDSNIGLFAASVLYWVFLKLKNKHYTLNQPSSKFFKRLITCPTPLGCVPPEVGRSVAPEWEVYHLPDASLCSPASCSAPAARSVQPWQQQKRSINYKASISFQQRPHATASGQNWKPPKILKYVEILTPL